MKHPIKKNIKYVLAFASIIILFWLLYKTSILIYQSFITLDTNVAAYIVAGSATIIASTLAVVVSRYYQANQERETVHRDKKIALYDEFLKKLFEIFLTDKDSKEMPDNFAPFLREIQRKLILWSGPDAIKAYAEWHEVLTTQNQGPVKAVTMIKMFDFFLALRKDLGHSNKSIKQDHMARFLLKNSNLFMQEYRKNADVTFEEIAALEKELANKEFTRPGNKR